MFTENDDVMEELAKSLKDSNLNDRNLNNESVLTNDEEEHYTTPKTNRPNNYNVFQPSRINIKPLVNNNYNNNSTSKLKWEFAK